MKKNNSFLSLSVVLFAIFALIFTGCPGGGDKPEEGGAGETEGLAAIFSETEGIQTETGNVTVTLGKDTIKITGTSATVGDDANNMAATLRTPGEEPFNAGPYTGIKFDYKSNTNWHLMLFPDISGGDDNGAWIHTDNGWNGISTTDEWTPLELPFSSFVVGWPDQYKSGGATPIASFDLVKETIFGMYIRAFDANVSNKTIELRNFQWIPDPNYVAPVLQSIKVGTQPTKTDYGVGEEFDPTGLVILGTYNDSKDRKIIGYSLSGGGVADLQAGDTTITTIATDEEEIEITVSYLTFTTTFNINVIADFGELTGITIAKGPNKTYYKKGEAFSSDGLLVTANYENGDKPNLTGYTLSAVSDSITTPIANLQNGNTAVTANYDDEITVTVTYQAFTDTFTITVEPEPLPTVTLTGGVLFDGDWADDVTATVTLQGEVNDGKLKITGTGNDAKIYVTFVSPIDISSYDLMKVTFDGGSKMLVFTIDMGEIKCSYLSDSSWAAQPSPTTIDFVDNFADYNGTKKIGDTDGILYGWEIFSNDGPVDITKISFESKP